MRTYQNSITWIALGLLAILLRWLIPASSIEEVYSRGIYQVVRMAIDFLIASWMPVAILYVFLIGGLGLLIQRTRRWWRQSMATRQRIFSALFGVLAFVGGAVFLFMTLWGFNYGRLPVEQVLNLSLEKPDIAYLESRVRSEGIALVELRAQIPGSDTTTLADATFPEDMEHQLREALEGMLSAYGYPTQGRVRGRILYPRGIFLRFSSAGLYFPWTGEGHIDAGLLPIQRPYTMAHELSHGYGFGDEGTCSFWAYLTSERTADPALKYAIRLGYWRTLAATWLRADREAYLAFRETLDTGIIADLEAINENLTAYPDILPELRYAAYDSYLKAQGINEGMLNYNRVVLLVESWRREGDRSGQ